MRSFVLKLSLLLITFPLLSKAQHITIDSLFWVITDTVAADQAEESFTNSSELNALFNQFGVSKYEQVFPYANTEALHHVYEIECNCDIDSLMDTMQENFPNMYTGYRRLDYEQVSLYDPADNMWGITLQNPNSWLWYLLKIQANLAWDITRGNPNLGVALLDTDFDISHPDLAGKISPLYDPFDNIAYDCQTSHPHGTEVAALLAGETAETGTTPNGQLASVGFNTKVMAYKAWAGDYIERALHASTIMGAKVLTSSAGGWTNCPDQSGIEELIVKEILDNGTTIIMPAGNGSVSYNVCNSIDSLHQTAFFPLSPYYDERIIIVSSTGVNDQHDYGTNTHSHYPYVDLCAPGYEILTATPDNCGTNQWPYTSGHGTSYSAPITAGVAALMYSVNPCLTPSWSQDILKNTTDPIADAANFPGVLGTGRLNAFKAVKAAQSSYSTSLDLYMKDRLEDFGDEQNPYSIMADRDNSPDIWVRNQQDGFDNQEHQEPEYQVSSPVYVYVRVRNKSCTSSNGNEELKLYWSKASSWSSWPQNWNGSQPTIGNLIGSADLSNLESGRDTIIEFTWTILDPYVHQNWASCLLARIENSSVDGITVYPNFLEEDVYHNNNIAMRNLMITDIIAGKAVPGDIGGVFYPHGTHVYIGNVTPNDNTEFDINFSISDDPSAPSILDKAEIKVIFDDEGWNIIEEQLEGNSDIEIIRDKEILITGDDVTISDISFPKETRVPIYVGFSFLADEISDTDPMQYEYHVRQYLSSESSLKGGVHFQINREERDDFDADAGEDKEIHLGDSVTITANSIGEAATYFWYDMENTLVNEGLSFTVAPNTNTSYRLEVIADADGYKDYDEMQVTVQQYWIDNIYPNPATDKIDINYMASQASSAYITIVNQTSTVSNDYSIDVNQNTKNIDLSSYESGIYTVVLVCDGIQRDSKNLVIQ